MISPATMNGLTQQRVLIVGDSARQVQPALASAMPSMAITSVSNYFEAIGELSAGRFVAVLGAAEPMARRADSVVRTLRELAPDSRLILFTDPAHEGLTRRLLEAGCDDYIVTPPTGRQISEAITRPLAHRGLEQPPAPAGEAPPEDTLGAWMKSDLAEMVLDCLVQSPHEAPAALLRKLNERLGTGGQMIRTGPGEQPPAAPEDQVVLTQPVGSAGSDGGSIHLLTDKAREAAGRPMLARLTSILGKVQAMQDRHAGMQRLAITDELTGLYNARYYRHFLSRIIERARAMRFPVTLLLFDIDDFKKYNDQFGHGVGDEILRETAMLMRRCCREHDLVARIGGDEFAVVFWEKEGPRQPREPRPADAPPPTRPPQDPLSIFNRFARLMSTQDFPGLGPSGKGTLTISAGLAVYPYDGRDIEELIAAADRALMFGAKKSGKNSIYLVGSNDQPQPAPKGEDEDRPDDT